MKRFLPLLLSLLLLTGCTVFVTVNGVTIYAPKTPVAASETPTHTNTPVKPTATRTASPTPSQTPSSVPSQTFTPFPTMTPVPMACTITVTTAVLNVREAPNTSSAIVFKASKGQQYTFTEEVLYVGDNEWVYITLPSNVKGWASPYYNKEVNATYENTQDCLDLRFPGGVQPTATPTSTPIVPTSTTGPFLTPTQEVAVGWHAVIPSINYNDMYASFDVLQSNGWRIGVKSVEDTATVDEVLRRGGMAIWRTTRVGDCPSMDQEPRTAALAWYTRYLPYLPANKNVIIEFSNECSDFLSNMPWTDIYYSESIRLFAGAGYKVVFGTQPPGWWNEGQIQALTLTLLAARQYGSCFGYHAYGVQSGLRVADSNLWIGYRHRQIHSWMEELGYGDIPFCVTEVGTGNGRELFDKTDCRVWVK